MKKRNDYYDGEENDGAWLGCLVIGSMVSALLLVLVLVFFSIMAVL